MYQLVVCDGSYININIDVDYIDIDNFMVIDIAIEILEVYPINPT